MLSAAHTSVGKSVSVVLSACSEYSLAGHLLVVTLKVEIKVVKLIRKEGVTGWGAGVS